VDITHSVLCHERTPKLFEKLDQTPLRGARTERVQGPIFDRKWITFAHACNAKDGGRDYFSDWIVTVR
jgi:hypothetical protein